MQTKIVDNETGETLDNPEDVDVSFKVMKKMPKNFRM